MCGIVGYIGNGDTSDVLLDSLGRLEYRGYDSAGIALVCEGELKVIKSFGRIHFLQEKMPKLIASVGIGHTRWATHGKPSEINAHPHQDCTGRIAVVHNGIIENYKELKDMLISKGHSFASETDTEVVAHLLEENCAGSTLRALQDTIKQLQGSFAFAIINQDEPDLIFAAKKESPLVIGIGEGQYFLASDVTAFLKYTKNAVFLEDGDIAVLSKAGIKIMDFEGYPVSREVQTIDWDLDSAEKAGYEHFMLKEIHEQPQSLKACIAGRLNELTGDVTLNELTLNEAAIHDLKRIIIIACGTSYHAGMLGKYAIEALTEIPVSIEIGSEIRYSSVHMDSRTLIIAVSQSGETADTHAAVKDALKKGAHVVAITNVVGSSISRVATDTIYTMAGPEIGVAATKTFTAQVVAMYMLAIYLGRNAGTLSADRSRGLIKALKALPQKAQQVLELDESVSKVAELFKESDTFFLVGRHLNYPIALEGALKIKEISYVFSDGFAAGELKHGPLALITTNVPVIAIATDCPTYDKVVSNIREIKARDASVIAIANESNTGIDQLADIVIRIPDASEYISPIMSVILLQIFSYYTALYRGCPIDKPRNLAKSVTVE